MGNLEVTSMIISTLRPRISIIYRIVFETLQIDRSEYDVQCSNIKPTVNESYES